MKNAETVIRRIFFYGAFVLAAFAVIAKIANLFNVSLIKGLPEPYRFLEIAAIGLLFSIAMQLHQIRLILGSKSIEGQK
jgi:hypothetical protein